MRLAVREAISEVSMHRSDIAVPIDMEAFSRGRSSCFGMHFASIRNCLSHLSEINGHSSIET